MSIKPTIPDDDNGSFRFAFGYRDTDHHWSHLQGWFIRYARRILTAPEFALIHQLSCYDFDDDGISSADNAELADAMQCTTRHIRRIKTGLIERGLLVITHHATYSEYDFSAIFDQVAQLVPSGWFETKKTRSPRADENVQDAKTDENVRKADVNVLPRRTKMSSTSNIYQVKEESLVPLVSQESHATPCETPKTEHDPDGTDTQGKVLETTTIIPAAPRPTTTTTPAPQPAKPKATRKPKAQPDTDKPRLKKDERYHELVDAVRALLFNGSNGKGFIQGRDVAILWHKGYTAEKLGQFVEWWDAEHNADPRKPRVYLPQAPETLEHWLYMFTQSTDSAMIETQPDPQCPRCGGSGYVIGKDEDGNEIARPCGCQNS